MAIWQVDFYFVFNNTSDIPYAVLAEDSFIKLLSVFPIGKSWNKDLIVYGELESTCLCVWKDSNNVEISCRLDVSSIKLQEINAIINFADTNGLMLFCNEQTISPTLDNIRKIIVDSSAYRFVKNPESFLNEINNKQL